MKTLIFLLLFIGIAFSQPIKDPLSIKQGGTGAYTAEGARASLGISSSPIVSIISSLGKLQNTTDTSIIFSIPVPANTWLDGQTILIKELYIYSTGDANDTIGFANIDFVYRIGDTIAFKQLDISQDCFPPDTCISALSFFARRIGNDILVSNGGSQTVANGFPGLTYGFPPSNLNIGITGSIFGDNTDANKPKYYRIHNVNFSTALNFTFTVNWRAAFPDDYIEARSATVWKY